MRLYSFVNYYLSPLQHGLQTAHCVSDMANHVAEHKGEDHGAYSMFHKWARDDKTIIICSGGNCETLENVHATLSDFGLEFGMPCVKFYEDKASLNGALTATAILVPAQVYEYREDPTEDPARMSSYVQRIKAFSDYLRSFRLA